MKEKYSKTVEELKNDVRSMLTAPDTKMIDTMNLIDTIERLGVAYHFENEIEEILQHYFHLNTNYQDDEAYDLYTVSLHFRLFRQHGHPISTGMYIHEVMRTLRLIYCFSLIFFIIIFAFVFSRNIW